MQKSLSSLLMVNTTKQVCFVTPIWYCILVKMIINTISLFVKSNVKNMFIHIQKK